MTDGAVLGIDLGTSEAKAILVGLDGTLLGSGRAPIATDVGTDGRAEQDPRDWWRACASAVRAIEALSSEGAMQPVAISVVGQGPTLAVVDEDARPLRPAITWQDRRIAGTGFGLLPKISWLAREDPDAAAEARWLLTSWDALGLWLTGEASQSLQAHETAPTAEELEAAGVRASQVPSALPFGTPLGWLRAEAAGALGLNPGIPVVAGVNDGTASMLGAGLRAAGDAVDTGGTSGGIGIYADRAVEVPGLFCAPAPLPGRWVVGGAMAATGAAVEWIRHVTGSGWGTDELFAAAAGVPAGAGGLVFLPYLAGERAPVFDERARGAFVGLTLGHGRAELARAVLEGAAFALRHVAQPLVDAGAPLLELRLAGRRSHDDTWARIKADVLGVPVAIPAIESTAVLGAAILAAAGTGLHPDLETAVVEMTAVDRRIEPDPSLREVYDARFEVYRSLYPALAPAMHALGE
ncbi:MAG TPA: FGGY-family carbohydrate kinase [Candidatus Limnocylindrales bacterium]|nr:FGGY-family carbohydrate kinase [Candidatus Limnocylindrales bacterium]